MRSFPLPYIAIILGLSLAGCDDSPAETDSGVDDTDSSVATDSGTETDGGATDPCSTEDPSTNIDCNGLSSGDQADNTFGGRCTPDPENFAGTCTNADAFCWDLDIDFELTDRGICYQTCTPSADTYLSTGGCPEGSRCFDLTEDFGFGVCAPACTSNDQCTTSACFLPDGFCNGEPASTGGDDAGMPGDAGVPDAG